MSGTSVARRSTNITVDLGGVGQSRALFHNRPIEDARLMCGSSRWRHWGSRRLGPHASLSRQGSVQSARCQQRSLPAASKARVRAVTAGGQ
eukprot:7335122-Pyramimonas_sp.AAC.1